MLILAQIAIRNLLRNWRRTLFTVATLGIGVTLSIWTDNITKGRADDIVEAVTSAYVGHYQISTEAFRANEMIQDYLSQDSQKEFDQFRNVSPRIHFQGLISSGENSLPVLLDGVLPEAENNVTHLKNRIIKGEYLNTNPENCENKEILISQEQAEKLNVGLGDKIVVVGPDAYGSLGNDLFRVKGIYQSESKAFDRRMSFAHSACVSMLGQISGPHELVFGLPADMNEQEFAGALAIKAKKLNLKLTSWKESVPQLYSIVRFSKAIHNAINFILFMVISIGIINVMMMTVYERTREFGVMAALGTDAKQVVSVVMIETLGIAILGLALGLVVGSLLVMYHHVVGFDLHMFLGDQYSAGQFSLSMMVYPKLTILSILRSSAITIGFMLIAGLFPAVRASRLTPIEAMRSL